MSDHTTQWQQGIEGPSNEADVDAWGRAGGVTLARDAELPGCCVAEYRASVGVMGGWAWCGMPVTFEVDLEAGEPERIAPFGVCFQHATQVPEGFPVRAWGPRDAANMDRTSAEMARADARPEPEGIVNLVEALSDAQVGRVRAEEREQLARRRLELILREARNRPKGAVDRLAVIEHEAEHYLFTAAPEDAEGNPSPSAEPRYPGLAALTERTWVEGGMPPTLLDVHAAIGQAHERGDDDRVRELQGLLDRLRAFYDYEAALARGVQLVDRPEPGV